MSRSLATNLANIPPRKAKKHANSQKVKHLGVFSMHLNQQFLLFCACFRCYPDDNWRFTFQVTFRIDEEDKDLYYKHIGVVVTYKCNTG
jgi:hypothetical protein